jgi:hypothetical protein
MEVFALAVYSVTCPSVRVVTEREQRGRIAVCNQPHVATLTAIAAIGSTKGHWSFTTEADTACAAVSTADI